MSRQKEAFCPAWIGQGKRIKELRNAKGLSQIALAEMLGYSTANTVYYWENGRSGIDYQELSALSKIFSVDIGYITGEQEHKNIADLVIKSKETLELLSSEYMKAHNDLSNLLWRFGYDLAVLEIENSNFATYMERHIAGLNDDELEKAIKESMIDYELLKAGFAK